jgi:hypothetical protein
VVLWGIAGLGLLLAVIALLSARRVSRKLDALSQSYWELRYDYTRLRSQVARLDPEVPEPDTAASSPSSSQASVTFVPLSTIRKKDT